MATASLALPGKTAIITGGAGGIGFAIAETFASAGASVVIADRDGAAAEQAHTVLAEWGARSLSFEVDIARAEQIDHLMDATMSHFGSVDILVNCAAHARFGFALDFSEEDWDYTHSISLRGNFFCAQRAARIMAAAGSGKIINISSMTVPLAHARNIAYSSAKGAMETITRILGLELAEYGIQVNAIAPGPIDTAMSRAALTEQGKAARLSRLPGGHFGAPADVAGAALFLASPSSDWITGAVLAVDGGYTATGTIEKRG